MFRAGKNYKADHFTGMDAGGTKAQIPLKNKGDHGFDGLKRIEQWGIKY